MQNCRNEKRLSCSGTANKQAVGVAKNIVILVRAGYVGHRSLTRNDGFSCISNQLLQAKNKHLIPFNERPTKMHLKAENLVGKLDKQPVNTRSMKSPCSHMKNGSLIPTWWWMSSGLKFHIDLDEIEILLHILVGHLHLLPINFELNALIKMSLSIMFYQKMVKHRRVYIKMCREKEVLQDIQGHWKVTNKEFKAKHLSRLRF